MAGENTWSVSLAGRDAPAGLTLEQHGVGHPGADRGIEGDLPLCP
ncbi:hypothetical protein [Rhodovulum sp. 12E13]|nr:hypothetical protein [Rhodovulum sp. 12E13]